MSHRPFRAENQPLIGSLLQVQMRGTLYLHHLAPPDKYIARAHILQATGVFGLYLDMSWADRDAIAGILLFHKRWELFEVHD